MSDQVRVNGNLLSRASCVLKMADEPFFAWTAIEFGDKRERAYGYGAGRHGGPLAMTSGKYTPDPLVISFFEHGAEAVEKALAGKASDGVSIGNPRVLWTLTIEEDGVASILEEFEGCALTERATSVEDSAEGVIRKLTFMPLRRRTNGRTLFDSSVSGSGA